MYIQKTDLTLYVPDDEYLWIVDVCVGGGDSILTISYICMAIWTLLSLFSVAFLNISCILLRLLAFSSLLRLVTLAMYSRELSSISVLISTK